MSFTRKAMVSRRTMLRRAAAASGLGAIFKLTEGEVAGQARGGRGGVNRNSSPSNLRITDIRNITIASNFDFGIYRLYTNQDVYGLAEGTGRGRDLYFVKSLLVGRNPLDIGGTLRSIRGRTTNAAYSIVDQLLLDLNGKVFNAPMWRLIGDKKRDAVRMYVDSTGTPNFKVYAERMLRRKKMGFTFFKMDITDRWIDGNRPGSYNSQGVITDKGLAYAGELLQAVRDAIGWDVPLAVDASSGYRRVPGGYSELPVPDAIRTARAYEKYDLAWVEDLYGAGFPIEHWQHYKAVKNATTAKILTGENGVWLEGFKGVVDNRAVDVVAPDPHRCGGLLEMKRIADYAYDTARIPSAIHMLGSPLAAIATAHCCCTMDNCLSMECHSADFLDWWTQLVTGVPQPVINEGYITVPNAPGVGVELNEPVVKEHLRNPGWFEPTTMWDEPARGPRGGWPHYDPDGKWTTEATQDY